MVEDADVLPQQDEFAFFIEDASSKMLLVPSGGNAPAEQAAAKLNVPIATLHIVDNGGMLQGVPYIAAPISFALAQKSRKDVRGWDDPQTHLHRLSFLISCNSTQVVYFWLGR